MMRLRDPSSAYEHGFEEPQVLHTDGERYTLEKDGQGGRIGGEEREG